MYIFVGLTAPINAILEELLEGADFYDDPHEDLWACVRLRYQEYFNLPIPTPDRILDELCLPVTICALSEEINDYEQEDLFLAWVPSVVDGEDFSRVVVPNITEEDRELAHESFVQFLHIMGVSSEVLGEVELTAWYGSWQDPRTFLS